jgi:hypothetical protein
LDRFSHLAICTALRCLSVGGLPLWERFNNDDNVLFTSRDFADPANSRLFRELWMLRNRDARAMVGHLVLSTRRPLDQTPLLDELVRDGEVRPLTATEQDEVHALLSSAEAPAALAQPKPEPTAATVETMPVMQAAPTVLATPAAAVAAPLEKPPTQEIIDAELVPPQSLLSLLLLPFLLLDRVLGTLAGGVQNALLHNFFRVVAAGAAVGAAPAIYYAPSLWRESSPPPVVPGPIATLPDVIPEPAEENPEPEPEPEPEPKVTPEVPPDPDKDPFVIETETPGPLPKPSPGPTITPGPVSPLPATTRQRPFEELERSSDGLALLKLPPLPSDIAGTSTPLAQLRIERPQDLELKLLGAGDVFSLARRVDLEPNDASLPGGKLRSWKVVRSRSEAGAFLSVKELIGEFSLDADQKLAFTWGSSTVVKNHGALRYCLLEMKVPTESVVCALAAPIETSLPDWSFNETNGIASLPLPDLDTLSLPPVERLRVELSLGAGQRLGPHPFTPEVRKEASSAGTEVSSSSPRFAFTGLLEVKAALSYDPQSAGSGRLVFAPEFIKKVYKRDGAVDELTPTSSSRLTRLRLDCETEIKRLTVGRDSKKRLADVDRWNQQLAVAQEKYFLAEEAMANSPNPSAVMLKRLDSLNREVEKFQILLDKRAQEDQESFDLQSFAEDNRSRCDQAILTLSQLEKSSINLRLYYEVEVNSSRRQINILRTSAVPAPLRGTKGKTKGRR